MLKSALLSSIDRYLRIGSIIGPQLGVGGAFGEGANQPNIFFVDATLGSDVNDGRDPGAPLATIQAALNKCVSGRGDVVVVEPGSYAETLSVTKDYVHIIAAVDGGYGRPDVVPTAGTALTVTGQGFVAINVRFYSADSDTVIQRGNGFKYHDCVFDGDTGQAATEALLRLKGVTNDDSYTASEGRIEECLLRNSNGFGVAFDVGDGAGNQVGCTDNYFYRCRFYGNAAEDVRAVDTSAGGAYSAQKNIFKECDFLDRNKATHIDLDTTNGAANTGNSFIRCNIFDDTVDATAVKIATANAGLIGCWSLDAAAIDGDALD